MSVRRAPRPDPPALAIPGRQVAPAPVMFVHALVDLSLLAAS
jgi:hypothetical protein